MLRQDRALPRSLMLSGQRLSEFASKVRLRPRRARVTASTQGGAHPWRRPARCRPGDCRGGERCHSAAPPLQVALTRTASGPVGCAWRNALAALLASSIRRARHSAKTRSAKRSGSRSLRGKVRACSSSKASARSGSPAFVARSASRRRRTSFYRLETADSGRPTGGGKASVEVAAGTGFEVSRQIGAGVEARTDVDAGMDADDGIVSGPRGVVAVGIAFEIAVGTWGYDPAVACGARSPAPEVAATVAGDGEDRFGTRLPSATPAAPTATTSPSAPPIFVPSEVHAAALAALVTTAAPAALARIAPRSRARCAGVRGVPARPRSRRASVSRLSLLIGRSGSRGGAGRRPHVRNRYGRPSVASRPRSL
jgi:hypothetical protein